MSRILLLGAGLVTHPLVRHILETTDHELTIADCTVEKAVALIEGHPRGTAIELLVDDEAALDAQVRAHDLTISLLPYTYHVQVARTCIAHRKHMVTTSYISDEMLALDAEAKAAGITILNEVGVDPGIDHMSAMRVIHDVARRGGTVTAFSSYCGGLPAPEDNDNPWGYKFSWSPRGVLMAGRNEARFLRDGEVVDVPGPELFAHHEMVEVPDCGTFEGYPNRDCLDYVTPYGLNGIRDMFRGTLRYPGWCDTLKAVADLGLLDETERPELEGKTFRGMMAMLVPATADVDGADAAAAVAAAHLGIEPDSEPIHRLAWLGIFDDEPLPEGPNTILDKLCARMESLLVYKPGERDMIALHHRFRAEFPDHEEAITSTLVDYGIPHGDTSMARNVSLPAAVAACLILTGDINARGVLAPVTAEIYEPVLVALEGMGIRCVERREVVEWQSGRVAK